MVGRQIIGLVFEFFMKPGFTLIELIVAITIFSLITLAAVVNFRGTSPDTQLRLQAANLSSVLRQAQALSQGGQPFVGVVPSGGYGVQIATCSVPPCNITLFADQNSNFTMEAPAEVVETISLGEAITIAGLNFSSPIHVVFRLPAGAICFDNACSGAVPLEVTLGARGSTSTKILTVNQVSGQISY